MTPADSDDEPETNVGFELDEFAQAFEDVHARLGVALPRFLT